MRQANAAAKAPPPMTVEQAAAAAAATAPFEPDGVESAGELAKAAAAPRQRQWPRE